MSETAAKKRHKYTPELGTAICERISEGESLRRVCADESMPNKKTVMRWLADEQYEDFRRQYEVARQRLVEHWSDEIVELVDGVPTDKGSVMKVRLQFDARRWLMSKLFPKKYGDRVVTELTGKDGGPVQFEDMTQEQVEKELTTLVGQIRGRGKDESTTH